MIEERQKKSAVWKLIHLLASLQLALILLATIAIACAAATFYESGFSTKVARTYIYHAPWFLLWLGVLCINLFAVTLSRWPWQKKHAGFIITHYGIITVFFTLIYKWLPTGGVPWRFAVVSGAVNSLLFAAGNRALVYYFEVTQITSAFGATAGFAAIMVWMYWTALTILVGAQVGRATRDVFTDDQVIQVPKEKI